MPYSPGDRTKEDLSLCGCTLSALAWKDPLEASPILSLFRKCARKQKALLAGTHLNSLCGLG